MTTQLISAHPRGGSPAQRPLDAPPATNTHWRDGRVQSAAPNLIGADTGGVAQVVQADGSGSGGTQQARLRQPKLRPGQRREHGPEISAAGTWVAFQSDASDVGSTRATAGPTSTRSPTHLLFTEPTRASTGCSARKAPRQPTTNPMMSPHGNYVVFERGGQVAQLAYTGAR